MSTTYVYTALIDVLSYRHRLELDIQSGEEDFKKDLELSLAVFDSVNTAIFGVQAISDTIILTCNLHENFLEFIQILKKVFVAFLERGLFVRGGIAYSKHFQNGKITYSHAVAKAYELESKTSVYPRIVIDANIIQMYQLGSVLPNILNQKLILKQNGVFFINILDSDNWNSSYEASLKIYNKDKDSIMNNEAAFLKQMWFQNYLLDSPYANKEKEKYLPQPLFI